MDYKTNIDFSPGSSARQKIKEEFQLPKWDSFRKWYFHNFTQNEKINFPEKFYKTCSERNTFIPFVPWFISVYVEPYITVLERNYKLLDEIFFQGVYPPQQEFQLDKFNFLAFAKLLENDTLPITCKHINNLFQQQTYTNIFLNVIGEQITSLH